jgi:hypothetical protein
MADHRKKGSGVGVIGKSTKNKYWLAIANGQPNIKMKREQRQKPALTS